MAKNSKDAVRNAALDYHALPKPGKLEIRATKPMANGRDLARAYSPGVAEASIAIENNPDNAGKYGTDEGADEGAERASETERNECEQLGRCQRYW